MAEKAKGKISRGTLISLVGQKLGMTKAETERVFNEIEDQIMANVRHGFDVAIGCGSFRKRTSRARQGRNPQTGETVDIPAKKKVKFVPSKVFKEAVL